MNWIMIDFICIVYISRSGICLCSA